MTWGDVSERITSVPFEEWLTRRTSGATDAHSWHHAFMDAP